MIENSTIQLAKVPIGGKEGIVWRRLHEEREDTCEAMLASSESGAQANHDLLQARLKKIDDALDRLMSGTYGSCLKCGRSIIAATRDTDPVETHCLIV
jgi:RNA polymerase-binding transcription factor DksA